MFQRFQSYLKEVLLEHVILTIWVISCSQQNQKTPQRYLQLWEKFRTLTSCTTGWIIIVVATRVTLKYECVLPLYEQYMIYYKSHNTYAEMCESIIWQVNVCQLESNLMVLYRKGAVMSWCLPVWRIWHNKKKREIRELHVVKTITKFWTWLVISSLIWGH